MSKQRPTDIEIVATSWQDLVLVCRSCSDAGFGAKGKDSLSRALKQAVRARGRRGLTGVMEVECFGVCPKHAVTLTLASHPGELLVVPEGELADTVLDRLEARHRACV